MVSNRAQDATAECDDRTAIVDDERQYFESVLTSFLLYEKWAIDTLDREHNAATQNLAKHPEGAKALKMVHDRAARRRDAVRTNGHLLRAIVKPHSATFRTRDELDYPERLPHADLSKVVSTINQLVREWGAEGADERQAAHGPILEALQRLLPDGGCLLVPGAGLARLAWELARLGYTAQANEFSYHMLIAADFVLNERLAKLGSVIVQPWALTACNIESADEQLRRVTIPDTPPSSLPSGANLSMVAGDFLAVYSNHTLHWDSVVTCFFIDTAHSVAEYLRCIARLLKPGGLWINHGPLLWHWHGMPDEVSVELTWEELRALIESFGFRIEEERRTVCEYTQVPRSMRTSCFKCVFFVARWPGALPMDVPR